MANVDEIENSFNNSFVDEPSDESEHEQNELEQNHCEQNNEEDKIANIIQQLQKSGAILKKKTVETQHCYTCKTDFNDVEKFHTHLLDHVILPSIILRRVDEDDDINDEDDENQWLSDPEKSPEYNTSSPVTISQGTNITKIGGITIKSNKINVSTFPITSLKGISNLLIKKIPSTNETKNEIFDYETKVNSPTEAKSSGTLKLKIKHFSDKRFEVVNGSENDFKNEEVSQDAEQSLDETKMDSVKTPEQSTNISEDEKNLINEIENAPDDNDSMFEEHEEKKVVVDEYLNTSIKKEPQFQNDESNNTPQQPKDVIINAKVKTESDPGSDSTVSSDNLENQLKVKSFANESKPKQVQNDPIVVPKPMLIPKVENNVIEINCDSDKEDDEIIFVSSSSLPDKKPPVGLSPSLDQSKNKEVSSTTPVAVHSNNLSSPAVSQSVINSSNMPSVSVSASTEKQHSFNWNAPSKYNESLEAMLADKNNDTLLENILSNHRKGGMSDFGTSEYISLDKLGPQHTCDICNLKFTSFSALDDHKKSTGHSNQLVMPSNTLNTMQPYQPSLMNDLNLLPVKQLAETVSKIAGVKTSSAPFTHQQNIMVNIQSFPGGMNQPMNVQPPTIPSNYNYSGMHQMPGNYQGFRMGHPNAPPPPQYPSHYQMGSQQPYPPNTYSQYIQPSPQNMYNQQMNTPLNPNFASQPYQQNYPPQPNLQYPQPSINQQVQPNQPLPVNNQMLPPVSVQGVMPNNTESVPVNLQPSPTDSGKTVTGGIKIQSIQTVNSSVLKSGMGTMAPKLGMKEIRGAVPGKGPRMARGGSFRPIRPAMRPSLQVGQSIRGGLRPGLTRGIKRPGPNNGVSGSPKKRMEVLIPDRHDNEDCQVMSLQQQRDNFPCIQSIQGSRDRNTSNVQLNSQLTVTKTKVRPPSPLPSAKDANAVANILASRGIKITQKSKTPPPTINIPNLGSNISVTPSKTSLSNFSLPESDFSCSLCNKSFTTNSNLTMHMAQMHSSSKMFKCDACPISYPSPIQLQEHKLAFHNVPNSEMGVPVIDLSQLGTLRKLSNLGITNFIPLANREQGGGCFGIPIVSTQNAMTGNTTNSLLSLGANGILSFGPVKPLPKC